VPALKENGRENSNTTSRTFLFLAHWLLISLLLISSWSGGLLAIDQRPWLKAYLSSWPGMQQVPFAHLLAASGWLALALAYAYVRLRRQRNTDKGAHARVTSYLRWLAGSLLLSGAVMLLGLWPTATKLLHDLHAALAVALLACVLWLSLIHI
jgi:hypothetical protein